MNYVDRLRKLAARELTGEIPVFEYSLAADEIERLRNLLSEAGDELEWLIDQRNNSGEEGPPRVWRLLSKIRNEMTPNANSASDAFKSKSI